MTARPPAKTGQRPWARSAAALGIALALSMAASCGGRRIQTPARDAESLARATAQGLSVEEVLGQLFMVSWSGIEPPPEIYRWIRERGLGGIKIFGWNSPEEGSALAATIAGLQAAANERPGGLPLLVATDQEGGWIRHVKAGTSVTPGNMAIGASGFPADAFESGRLIGRELAALGINMDFAPTVDLATESSSWLIGSRAFSSDPMETALLGAAFARGLESSGVAATAKHFPGHGATSLDSHRVLPSLSIAWDRLWERELIPFRVLAAEGIDAMMTGHLAFPSVDASGAPASLSPFFIKTVLRERMGYQGVVVTDDLLMGGATAWGGGLTRTARIALEAGNDILLFSSLPSESLWASLLETLRSDPGLLDSCRKSAERVIALKLKRIVHGDAAGGREHGVGPDELPLPEAEALNLSLAARSITMIRRGDLPLASDAPGILLVGAFDSFMKEGLRYFPTARTLRVSYMGGDERQARDAAEAAAAASGAQTIILCLANDEPLPLLRALRDSGKRVYVISVLSPAPLAGLDWPRALLAAYSWSAESFNAAFAVLRGDIEASGRLPLEL